MNVEEPSDDSMRSPQFTQKLKNLTINDGEQLELKVKVDGDPEPQITWSKDGKVDTSLRNYTILAIKSYVYYLPVQYYKLNL